MSDKIADPARRRSGGRGSGGRQRRCPVCGKPAQEKTRPFCSERCRKIDLDRWRGEAYRVPTEESPNAEGVIPSKEDDP
jgi:uncharacterized protein